MNRFASLARSACQSCRVKAKGIILVVRSYSSASAHEIAISKRRQNRSLQTRLPNQPARTRFAPSPTGYLHLGSLRTALYNYLLARATNGHFILRLEDTDQSRIVPDAESRLYEDLRWSGLKWDEGPDRGGLYGPYKQSQRLNIYGDYVKLLLKDGKAFRCFCSHEQLSSHHHRTLETNGMFGTYPGRCLSISADESEERAAGGESHTVRFRSSPSPPVVHDIVYGPYQKKLTEDHFIIMKSDGFPTYHFANVVDDHLMGITHVIRGAEWLISSAKHVSLYNAFGWETPSFVHVGLLVDSKHQKLSKRNMDIGIDSYRRDGILPSALLNFSALLGWNPGLTLDKGVMNLDDMIKNFEMKFTKGDIVVNPEKLAFFQKKHVLKALGKPSPENDTLIDEYISGPLLQKAREIEFERKRLLTDGVDQNPLYSLGRPILHLAPLASGRNCSGTLQRLRKALRILRSETTDLAAMVNANRYLIWRPSTGRLSDSLPCFLPESTKIMINGELVSTADVAEFLISQFVRIDDSGWSVDILRLALDAATKRLTFCEAGQPPAPLIYQFLHWALLGLDNGPQMSHLLEYLGRAETLERLKVAHTVAKSQCPSST